MLKEKANQNRSQILNLHIINIINWGDKLGIYRCCKCGYENDSYFDLCPKCGKKQRRMLYETEQDIEKEYS
jgi:lipopolysaccharide biosynthesis regulator YciM